QQKQLTVTEAGRAVRVETDLPHLVGLGSGRFSTAVTLHPLPEGSTTVGNSNSDIIIRGRHMEPQHCYFVNENDVVVLFPISDVISVDGAKVTRPTVLSQGSMICFGRNQYYRFNHPAEAQHLKS
ncbi:hypothetical protein HELRODRAFT_132863, partial [Helobdella robusta]|uniref:FHA domain-containing protein n=1 Tax=Helobdella robusta TaxID=6412 RepID=T1EHZ8_HELRO